MEKSEMYKVVAKGYPNVTISLNGRTVAYAETHTSFSGIPVALVHLSLKEGDKITHTGYAMQMIKV